MNRLRRVVNNTIISLTGQLVTWTSTLLLTVAYGRFLSDVEFGEFYFAFTFVALIGFPIEFGFNQQLTRDVAQEPGKALRYLSNTLLIKVLLWLVFYALILLATWGLGYNQEILKLVVICGFILLSTSITNTFMSSHYAFEQVRFPVIGTILEKGLGAFFGFIILRQGGGVEMMALVLLGGSIANGIWQAIWFFRLVGTRLTIDRAVIRELVRSSIPFLTYGVLGVIYYRLDTVLLSLLTNSAVVGWYGAGYRLFDTLVFLPSLVISAIMYPVFSKLSISSERDLKVAIEKSMNFLLFCGLPIATALIAAAPNVIGFLYHRSDYSNTVPALQALAPGLVFLYINAILSAVLISTKNEKKITFMAGAALVFNLGLNLILIPRYQHIGAAIVTSLTELLLMSIALILIPRKLIPIGSLLVGVKALLASLIMAVVITMITTFSIFIILPIAMLVYFVAATLLGTIPRNDLQTLYGAIRKKANRASSSDHTVEQSGLDLERQLVLEEIKTIRLPRVMLPMSEHLPQFVIEEMITIQLPSVTPPMPEHLPKRIIQEEGDEITVRVPRIKKGTVLEKNGAILEKSRLAPEGSTIRGGTTK